MAAPGPENIIARRVSDDLIDFNGETSMTALVAELQAMENQDEVYNGLLAAKDAKRGEESKLVALNDLIAKALDDIDTLEIDVEILDGDDNGV
ncbi:hypothetical protein Tco_0989738 [Tanacetum coccineum]|uniref:Uncharacterized protein n=1 Tax=Tanacetum coccineum TaxID=301880 RepID=A0ABQ5EV56_9ASTR